MSRHMSHTFVAASATLLLIAAGAPPAAATAGGSMPPDERDQIIEEAVTDAIVALDAEILVLVELDGGPDADVPPDLADVYEQWADYTDGMSDAALIEWLKDVDQDGLRALGTLTAAGVPVSDETRTALGTLSAEDIRSLENGGPISIDPRVYVIARRHLELGDGAGPSDVATVTVAPTTVVPPAVTPSTVTPSTVTASTVTASTVTEAVVPVATTASASLPAATDSRSSSTAPLLAGIAALAITALAAAWILRRRDDPPATTQTDQMPADELFDLLSEAARRMTNALDTSEIARIALGQAMRMVRSRHGAFVEVGADGLNAIASSDDLLDLRSLDQGLLSRVADTGQTIRRIAHDEPAITSLPAAVLAVPIIGTGRVSAILFLVRPDTTPFSDEDENTIGRLAPMVGSALAAASRHGDATALSRTDALTGLANRRKLDEDLVEILGTQTTTTGIVMIDVDHFKHFNDHNGHTAGDEALRAVAAALRAEVRPQDLVYRYGGEEFSLVLPGVASDEARRVAERVRGAVERSTVPGSADQPGGALTISIGVALVGRVGPEEAIRLADGALYDAKAGGRNRVVLVEGADRLSVS